MRASGANAEARAFVRETEERFDLIDIALVDAYGSSAAARTRSGESYLYTGKRSPR